MQKKVKRATRIIIASCFLMGMIFFSRNHANSIPDASFLAKIYLFCFFTTWFIMDSSYKGVLKPLGIDPQRWAHRKGRFFGAIFEVISLLAMSLILLSYPLFFEKYNLDKERGHAGFILWLGILCYVAALTAYHSFYLLKKKYIKM